MKHELIGFWRRRRFLVLGAVLLFFGALAPLSIRYLPQILAQVPGTPEGIEAVLPQADASMALNEFGQNMTQIGAIMVVLMTMGAIVQERERNTIILVLSKPVSRAAYLGAKHLSLALLLLFGLVIGSATGYYYLGLLFQWLPTGGFTVYASTLYFYWLLIAGITLLGGVWARSQMAVAGISLGILFAGSLIGLIPALKSYMPAAAMNWASTMALGIEAHPPWAALGILLLADLVLPLLAWVSFRRQEL
jgi:ABC-2 type transport system permease protein